MGLNRCRHDLPCRPGPAGAGPSGKAIPGKRFVGDCDPTEPRPSGWADTVLPHGRGSVLCGRGTVLCGRITVLCSGLGLVCQPLPCRVALTKKQSRDRQGAITMFRPPSRSGLRVMRSGLHVVRKSLRSAHQKVGTRFWVPTVLLAKNVDRSMTSRGTCRQSR